MVSFFKFFNNVVIGIILSNVFYICVDCKWIVGICFYVSFYFLIKVIILFFGIFFFRRVLILLMKFIIDMILFFFFWCKCLVFEIFLIV